MKTWLYKALVLVSIVGVGAGCTNENAPKSVNEMGEAKSQNNIFKGDGWSFEYPKHFDKSSSDYIQESSSGKSISFEASSTTLDELKAWIQSEIDRKLESTEADQSLVQPLEESELGSLKMYRYVIRSDSGDRDPVDIPTVILFDGSRKFEFRTHQPPVTKEEFDMVINTFKVEQ